MPETTGVDRVQYGLRHEVRHLTTVRRHRLQDDQGRARGNPSQAATAQLSISGDDPSDMRTVSGVVLETASKAVVLACVEIDPASEIGVCRIHARVDDRDADTLPRDGEAIGHAQSGADPIHPYVDASPGRRAAAPDFSNQCRQANCVST